MDTTNKIVLLAEDDDDDRIVFAEILKAVDPSMVLFTSENGCEALKRLDQRGFSPDVIFMDIRMPVMDGIECLTKIKESRKYREIPVIIFTAFPDSKTLEECLKLGASGYIKKSENIKETVAEIKNALSRLI